MQKTLFHYVKHTMPKEHGITPVTSDRAFYPLPHDIKNHVGNAKSVLELSKLDQENLRLKVEEWHKTFPQSIHYFRPYVKLKEEDNACSDENLSPNVPGTYVGRSGCNDEWVRYRGVSNEGYTQTLLWVHQEKWQKDLLVKYGNTITLIDATYKTTRYDLALFPCTIFSMCTNKCWLHSENFNKKLFKELLTEVNKPTIEEHVRHMGLQHTWGSHAC